MSETANPTPTPSPAPAPHPAFGGPPASNGTSMVQITAEELNRLLGLRGELDGLRNQKAAELATKEAERLTAIAAKDGAEKALDEQRKAWEAKLADATSSFNKVRDLYHGKAKAEALAGPLAGVEFAGDKPELKAVAAAQFRSIVEARFETYEDAQGNLIVREKGTGRPAADVMKELINAPEYSHFFSTKNRGGSGTDGTRPPSNGQQQLNPDGNPHPVGSHEWALWRWQQGQQAASKLRLKSK